MLVQFQDCSWVFTKVVVSVLDVGMGSEQLV